MQNLAIQLRWFGLLKLDSRRVLHRRCSNVTGEADEREPPRRARRHGDIESITGVVGRVVWNGVGADVDAV